MTYEPTRADQIFNRFVAFHTANPDVFKLFEKFTLRGGSIMGSRR